MRAIVTLKYYLKQILGQSLMWVLGINALIALAVPLVIAIQAPESGGSQTDIISTLVLYTAISAGIHANYYSRMHIALGTTRKAIWLGQTALGTVILSAAAVLLGTAIQWAIAQVGNGVGRLLHINVAIAYSPLQQLLIGRDSLWSTLVLMIAIAFALMAVVQCVVYFFLRWKKRMLLAVLFAGALLMWLTLSRTDVLVNAALGLFSGAKLAVSGKLALIGAAFVGASYLPLRRLAMK